MQVTIGHFVNVVGRLRPKAWSVLPLAMGMILGPWIPSAAQPTEILTVLGTVWKYLPDGSLCADNHSWTTADFDDGSWLSSEPTGNGLFAAIETTPYSFPFNTPLIAPQSGGSRTDYFRTTVMWDKSISNVYFFGTLYVDDGVIVYLNGIEVFRFNMNDAALVNYELGTLDCNYDPGTSNPGGEPVEVPAAFFIPAGVLRDGSNLLAVELHTAGPSGDKVFGLQLNADFLTPPNPMVHPASTNLLQGRSFALNAEVDGAAVSTFQWHLDGVDIPGATNATYTVLDADPELHSGPYTVTVSNPLGTATSDSTGVTVLEDDEPPLLERATLLLDGTLRLHFNEAMDASHFGLFGIWFFETGSDQPVARAVTYQFLTPAALQLTSEPALDPATPYEMVILDDALRDRFGNSIADTYRALLSERVAVPWMADWRYDDTSPGRDWITNEIPFYSDAFDDRAWKIGRAPLGTEQNHLPPIPGMEEPLLFRTPVFCPGLGGPLTSYYRHHFRVPKDGGRVAAARIHFVVDDGCVVYLNGMEVIRVRVPPGQSAATLAAGGETYEGPFELDAGLVRGGLNTLAVELHQESASSLDNFWAGELSLETERPLRLTGIVVDSFGRVVLEHNGPLLGRPVTIQETAELAATPEQTPWTNLPAGPHGSPWDAGFVTGSRYFRIVAP